MIVAFDVDGVVAELHKAWLALYNLDYKDKLTLEDITSWDIQEVVKPECGESIYTYLETPRLYGYVPPIEGALECVNAIRGKGHRVIFVTSSNCTHSGTKMIWLDRFGFIKMKHGSSEDYIVAKDKSLINADVLIDDHEFNLYGVQELRGKSILFDRPYNRHVVDLERACGHEEVLKKVLSYV